MHVARKAVAGLEEARREVETVTQCIREGRPARPVPGDTANPGAVRVAAGRLGVDRRSLADRIGTPDQPGSHFRRFGLQPDWAAGDKIAAERGEAGFEPVLAGFAVKEIATNRDKDGEVKQDWVRQAKAPGPIAEVPRGHVVKAMSILRDGEGRVKLDWMKTAEGRSPEDLVADIRAALAEMPERARPVPPPADSMADLATVYPLADLHIGLMTWKGETGTSWDLDIAREVISENVTRLIQMAPPSRQAVILGLGDLLHADGYDNATPKSKNALDVDGRYPRVLDVAVDLIRETVRQALEKHEQVLLRILPGNHDPESTVGVNLALRLFYESDPRVTVDASASPFWWWRWGVNLLGATHGDGAKMPDLPLIMATSVKPDDWAVSKVREIHTGHIHSETKRDIRGIIVESHRTPIPPDSWHHRMGYGGGRSMCAITYHRRRGRLYRHDSPILAPDLPEFEQEKIAA